MHPVFTRSKRTIIVALAVCTALVIAKPTMADTPAPGGPLDGMVFAGRIGPADSPDLPDYLYFDEGRFWSGECVRCGFEPGVYWIRYTSDGIAFRGVLESPDRGTFTYDGLIRGDEIDVSIRWRHERWYWTIDRDLRFVGERLTGENARMSIEQARALAGGGDEPRPDRCPS